MIPVGRRKGRTANEKGKLPCLIWMKKIFFSFLACILLAGSFSVSEVAAKEKSYLGMPQSRWEEAIKDFPIHNHLAFYKEMEDSAGELSQTNDAKHYEKLDSDGSLRQKHKDNPLLQFKPKKTGKRYMTNLKLDEGDFNNAVSLIKILSQGYSETDVASLMPYAAYCINNNISLQDIRFYCRWFVRADVPVDVATVRFYRLVSDTEEVARDIFKQ